MSLKTRSITDDAAKAIGLPPYGFSCNPCIGDPYFHADCAGHWGETEWSIACKKALELLQIGQRASQQAIAGAPPVG